MAAPIETPPTVNDSSPTTVTTPAVSAPPVVSDVIGSDAGQGQSTAAFASTDPRRTDSLQGAVERTRAEASGADNNNTATMTDWRVRLSLGPKANYLYKATNPGILAPLSYTDGVIFPYTPNIQVSYAANYSATDLVHNNYKFWQYTNSSVDSIQITCDFTAQTTSEANYVLAVIHFFRSVTKMFYGKDQNPVRGTPPPLCYLTGLGAYQFNDHPLVVQNFNYSLPTDVDYIRARISTNAPAGTPESNKANTSASAGGRLFGILPGGDPEPPQWIGDPTIEQEKAPTYVPTKIQMAITCLPVVSRSDISNEFSLEEYAKGGLLRGGDRATGGYGGIW